MKSAYKMGCSGTGNAHFSRFWSFLDKTKWRLIAQTAAWYTPLSHSISVNKRELWSKSIAQYETQLKHSPGCWHYSRWLCLAHWSSSRVQIATLKKTAFSSLHVTLKEWCGSSLYISCRGCSSTSCWSV